jgi:hypothetical protein
MLRAGDGRADIWPMAYGFGKSLADIFAAMCWGNSKDSRGHDTVPVSSFF